MSTRTNSATDSPTGRRARTAAGVVLMLVAALLAPAAIVSHWVRTDAQNTERFVDAVGPLSQDPDVQDAVALRMSAEVLAAIDILDSVRPAAEALVTQASRQVVASPQFEESWRAANRFAHEQLVASLTGGESGTITVDLTPLAATLKQSLIDSNFPFANRIPDLTVSYTLLDTSRLDRVQGMLERLDRWGGWLPWLTLALAVAAVVLAANRAAVLAVGGFSIAATTGLLLLGFGVIRPRALDAVPTTAVPRDAAGRVYDALTNSLHGEARTVFFASLAAAVIGVVTWVAGLARRTRDA